MGEDLKRILSSLNGIRQKALSLQKRCFHSQVFSFESESIWVWCDDCGLFEDHELDETDYILRISNSKAVKYGEAKAALDRYRHLPVLKKR